MLNGKFDISARIEFRLRLLYLLPKTMATFEFTIQEKNLNVKIRPSVKGGVEVGSMTRDGALHKAYIEKNIRPGIGDKLVAVNGQDVSSLMPDEVFDILRVVLNGGEDAVLGITRHHSGILLNPIDAGAHKNHEWNMIIGREQMGSLHRCSRNAVREKLFTNRFGPIRNALGSRHIQNLRDIDDQVEVWRREDTAFVRGIIFGED
tara:strand:- start:24 stop:638 length:615 start_codon:yes stop_codon:yes gene_type:complete